MAIYQRLFDLLKSFLRHFQRKDNHLYVKKRKEKKKMYLVCGHCETDDIEVTSPYDSHPFYWK